MKLNEMVNKKLQTACNRLSRSLKQAGYDSPSHTVTVRIVDNTRVHVSVLLNSFISAKEQRLFDRELAEVQAMIETALEPTKIVDNSYFGGHFESLIKRDKKLDANSLLSDIELTARLPVNRYT